MGVAVHGEADLSPDKGGQFGAAGCVNAAAACCSGKTSIPAAAERAGDGGQLRNTRRDTPNMPRS